MLWCPEIDHNISSLVNDSGRHRYGAVTVCANADGKADLMSRSLRRSQSTARPWRLGLSETSTSGPERKHEGPPNSEEGNSGTSAGAAIRGLNPGPPFGLHPGTGRAGKTGTLTTCVAGTALALDTRGFTEYQGR